MTTLPLSVSRVSGKCGSLDVSQTYAPSRPVTRIALLLSFTLYSPVFSVLFVHHPLIVLLLHPPYYHFIVLFPLLCRLLCKCSSSLCLCCLFPFFSNVKNFSDPNYYAYGFGTAQHLQCLCGSRPLFLIFLCGNAVL
jgi:hypothetical protein